ncbi:MAG TPA: hypothetical protein VKP14_07230 [Gaiellaceae bacterium]|nr:hypothetical protein [Gaiellaceae bacterium]
MSVIEGLPRTEAEAVERSLIDRLGAALPLAGIYVVLCMIYLVEVWKRVTPWLFGDELELTQLSRSIASTGHAARRGAPHSPDSIYTYAMAPFWRIHDVSKAYAAIKYLDVFVMTSVVFPTYFLARLVVGRRAALFAAAGAAAIPSLAYSSYIVEETFAYPFAALCFFLIAKMLVERRSGRRWYGWLAAAVLASGFAPAVRSELAVIPAVLALAMFFAAWSSDRARARRRSWSAGDWIGAIVVGFGVIFVLSGIASHHSLQWLSVTRYYKHRIIVEGNWAIGALAIGVGIVPMVAGIASLFDAPGQARDRGVRMFRCVTLAGFIAFGTYTAFKAAYLSTTFATRVEERNLIYVAPLLFIGTALVLARRSVNLPALAATTAYALYLVGYALYHVVGSPYEMGVRLYSDALGFAIAQRANLELYWTPSTVRIVLISAALIGVGLLLSLRGLLARPRIAGGVAIALGAGILAWNLAGELSAAAGTNELSHSYARTLGHPFSWVDDATHLRSTLYVGAGEEDQNPEWLLEFWNRSIARVTSLDGTVQGPGPAPGPNLERNGTLIWGSSPRDLGPQYTYAVEDRPCIDLAGAPVAEHQYHAGGLAQGWRLLRLTRPNRLRSMCTGIWPDGWSGDHDSAYFRFSGPAGWLRIDYTRLDWGYPSGSTPVEFLLGTLVINANDQPILGRVTRTVDRSIDSAQAKVEWLRVPAGPFAVHVAVAKKVVPHDFNPASGDQRKLGVELRYEFRESR